MEKPGNSKPIKNYHRKQKVLDNPKIILTAKIFKDFRNF